MRRCSGRRAPCLIAGLLVLAACSPDEDVSEDTAVPTDSSEPSATAPRRPKPTRVEPRHRRASNRPRSVALPGLLDPSDEPIAERRRRPHRHARQRAAVLRAPQRPSRRQGLAAPGDRRRLGRRDRAEHRCRPLRRAHAVQRHRAVPRERADRRAAQLRCRVRGRHQRLHLVRRDGVRARRAQRRRLARRRDERCSTSGCRTPRSTPTRSRPSAAIVTDEWRSSTQTVDGRLFDVAAGPVPRRHAVRGSRSDRHRRVDRQRAASTSCVEFYDDWYRPDNAAVVVVGDIDVDDMVADIEERFGSAAPRTEAMPARPDTTFPIETEPDFALHSDPDQTTVDVEVDLPIPAIESDGTAALRASILDSMIYSALIRRLDQDVSAGDAAVRRHHPRHQLVRRLARRAGAVRDHRPPTASTPRSRRCSTSTSAPTGSASPTPRPTSPRRRHRPSSTRCTTGATPPRTSTTPTSTSPTSSTGDAVPARRRPVRDRHRDDRRRSRPRRSTCGSGRAGSNTAPHVIISTPEAGGGGDAERGRGAGDDRRHRATAISSPRDGGRELPDELMVAPEPVDAGVTRGTARRRRPLLRSGRDRLPQRRPRESSPRTTSSRVRSAFQAASPGGSSLVADDDVVDALYAADDRHQQRGRRLQPDRARADPRRPRCRRRRLRSRPTSTRSRAVPPRSDIETLFQLVHLYMTQPRFDAGGAQPGAADRRVRSSPTRPPTPDIAGYDALLDARYPGRAAVRRRCRHPNSSPRSISRASSVCGVTATATPATGCSCSPATSTSTNWSISPSRYIGTLPGDGTVEQWVDVEDPPPAGVVRADRAGRHRRLVVADAAVHDARSTRSTARLRANNDVVTEVI